MFKRLPGVRQEAKKLKDLIPDATVLKDEKATESAVKEVRGPLFLHIATHGFFLPDLSEPSDVTAAITSRQGAVGASSVLPEDPLFRSGLALEGANRRASGGED